MAEEPPPRKTASGSAPGAFAVVATLLALLTALVFLPALKGEFLNNDDVLNFVENERNLGFGWRQLAWALTESHIGVYTPLSWMTIAVDYEIAGLSPRQLHRTNLIIHMINAVLLLAVFAAFLRRALGEARARQDRWLILSASGVGAAIYALHPMRVEIVAWASARNNLVGAMFFLAALLAYLKARRDEGGRTRRGWRIGVVVLYACALLSKSYTIGLPIVLLILDGFPLGRIRPGDLRSSLRRVLIEKTPYLGAAVAVGVATYLFRSEVHPPGYPLVQRLATAAYALMYYPLKMLVPVGLSPYHPVPMHFDPVRWVYVASGLAAAGVTLFALMGARHRPWFSASWGYYVVMVAPLLGVIPLGAYLVADRYAELSTMSFALLAAGGVYVWWRRGSWHRAAAPTAAIAVLAVLCVLTRFEITHWRNSERLWTRVLELYPENQLAQFHLGQAHAESGAVDAATAWYARAARPREGPGAESIPVVDWRIRALNEMAGIRLRQHDYDGAAACYRQVVSLDTGFTPAVFNLALALLRLDRPEEAIEVCRHGLRVSEHSDWLGVRAEDFRNVLREASEWIRNRDAGRSAALAGEPEKAAAVYREELLARAWNVEARMRLAGILLGVGRHSEAKSVLAEGVELRPDQREQKLMLAWVLSTSFDDDVRDGSLAIELVESLLPEDGWRSASVPELDVLAAAYAEVGRFEEALRVIHHALTLATDGNRGHLEARAEEYARLRAHREPGVHSGRPAP